MSSADARPASPSPERGPTRWADLPEDLQAAFKAEWGKAAKAHRSLALPLVAFVEDVLKLWRRGKARLGLAADVTRLRDDLPGLHHADLYLARLCEQGEESAWRSFAHRYEPDLRRVLQRQVGVDEAVALASAVIADTSLPPARAPDRTLLGSYEGTGPLWAWLATIGIRRLRRHWRRREQPLEAAGEPAAPTRETGQEHGAEARRFLAALQEAWRALEPREGLALLWKHRDGLSQREVSRLLVVSEPTVSRIVASALAKIRGRVAPLLEGPDVTEAELWPRLASVLSIHFESLPPVPHRTVDEP